jgi:hypothetical protein
VLVGNPSKIGAASRLRCCPAPRLLHGRSCPSGAETSRAVNRKPRAGESLRAQQARGSEAAVGVAEGPYRWDEAAGAPREVVAVEPHHAV